MSQEENFVVECPHCKLFVFIEKLNCGIFRHGIITRTGEQIEPHAKKEKCDELIKNQEIVGCGKPFQVIKKDGDGEFTAIVCDYI